MIAILDYGIGNVNSIKNMLKKIGADSVLTQDTDVIWGCEKIILPGIGNFDYCMKQLRKASFYESLDDLVSAKKPILGVCVGLQMLFESSEEGNETGLGWIKGKVVKFDSTRMRDGEKRIPHMGWNEIKILKQTPISIGLDHESRFYFVHSYHCIPEDKENSLFSTDYGYEFTSAVEKDNIIGVQFHPEKSHKFGIQFYKNFVENY